MTYTGWWFDKTTDYNDYFTSDCSYLHNCNLVSSYGSTVSWNAYPNTVDITWNGRIRMRFNYDEFEPTNVYMNC